MATKKVTSKTKAVVKKTTGTSKPKKNSFTKQDFIKLGIFSALLIAITSLTFMNLFSEQDKLDRVIEELQNANLFWAIVLFAGVPLVWLITDSLVLWILTKKTYTIYKFRQAMSAVGLYIIFSLLTPFQSGGQIFQIIYMRKQGVKYSTAVSATVAAAVMFQLVTVPVSTALFAYTTLNGDLFSSLVISGFSSNIVWWLTALALSVNLILMVIPILISVSTPILNWLARRSANITALSYRTKVVNATRDAKICLTFTGLLAGTAVFLWLFGPHLFESGYLFKMDKIIFLLLALLMFAWTRVHFLELTPKKYKAKVKSTTESMLAYKETFKSTVFNKSILIPCLAIMFVKEMNHSFSLVWSAYMVGETDFNPFDLMALKNVLTLAQTTIPTPGGSGGAELFYIAAAQSVVVNHDPTTIGLLTRFSTYWFLLLWGFVVKTVWRPSRDGFGIPDRASLNPTRRQKIKSKFSHKSETQVLKIKKGQ